MRRRLGPALVLAAIGVSACNAIIGGHDRSLEDDDAGPPDPSSSSSGGGGTDPAVDGGGGPVEGPKDAGGDADADAGPAWYTPNGAVFDVDGGAVTITDFDASDTGHPIVLQTPIGAPSGDYTVTAKLYAPVACEFGVVARVQPDHTALLLGSMFGGAANVWVGQFPSSNWNPSMIGTPSTEYTFVAPKHYMMKLQLSGATASGKMWDADGVEPQFFQVQVNVGSAGTQWLTGTGAGFYVNGTNGVVLEKLETTVP